MFSLQPTFLLQFQWPSCTHIHNHRKNYHSVNLRLCIYYSLLEDKSFRTEWWQTFLEFNLFFISSCIEFLFGKTVPKYSNCSTLSKALLSIFVLWIRLAFWSRDMTMYLVLSSLASTLIYLLATSRNSVFFFIICMLPPNIFKLSA